MWETLAAKNLDIMTGGWQTHSRDDFEMVIYIYICMYIMALDLPHEWEYSN